MSSRKLIKRSLAREGASSTILFGETIGRVVKGERDAVQTGIAGGLARRRGRVPRMEEPSEHPLSGDTKHADWKGFGSCHPQGVNFAFTDGHVNILQCEIDVRLFYG